MIKMYEQRVTNIKTYQHKKKISIPFMIKRNSFQKALSYHFLFII